MKYISAILNEKLSETLSIVYTVKYNLLIKCIYLLTGIISINAQQNAIEPIVPLCLPEVVNAPGKYYIITQGNSVFFRNKYQIPNNYNIDTSNIIYEFLPLNGVFKKLATSHFVRHHYGAVYYQNNIYMLGGFNQKGNKTNKVYIYQLNNKQWTEKFPNLLKNRALMGAAINGNKIYCIWGDEQSTIEVFDFETNKWSLIEVRYIQSCKPLTEVIGSVSVDNNIYIFGKDGNFKIFNVSDLSIRDGETCPFQLNYFGVTTFNRRIYVAAGSTPQEIDKQVYMYSTVNQSWSKVGKIAVDRCGSGLVFHAGMLFYIGGSPSNMYEQTQPAGEIFIYRPMQ